MRTLVLSALLACSATLSAQTYFYIDAIAVDPPEPTTADNISIQLIGGLSSGGAYIASSSAQVVGSQVIISIVAMDPGGITVIVPHTEVVPLGQLPAGTYTISFNAVNVGDFAPSPEHIFQVTGAGSSCDSLIIQGVNWHPFQEDALVVSAYHYLLDTLITPSFTLFDLQGDSIATETAPFPTWAPYQDDPHTLLLQPGVSLPGNTVEGTVDLSSPDFNGTACVFNASYDLCPTAACVDMSPVIQNLGGGITIGTFAWNITDGNGAAVAIGSFELTETQQADTGSACLPPGTYTLLVAPLDEPTGGQPWVGVVQGTLVGPSQPLMWTDPQPLSFGFYLPCVQGTESIGESAPHPFSVIQHGDQLSVRRADGRPIGPVALFDAQGRLVARNAGLGNEVRLSIATTAPGIYTLSTTGGSLRVPCGW
jgi:hypothetical protein